MKVRLPLFFCLLIIGGQIHSFAQCALIDFSINPAVCLNERTVVEDTGMASLRDWDFCSGDFNQSPSAQLDYTLSAALGRPGIDFVKDGNRWYGFVTGTWSSILYRLQYANGINSPPTAIDNLGNLGGALNQPGQIRIIKNDDGWFGLIHNAGSTGGELLKLSFGDKLSNPITIITLASGFTNVNSGLAVGRDETDGWVCILSSATNQFTIVRLGFDLSAPAPTDIINSVNVPDQNNLGDVDLIKECDEWFGFATNFGNGNLYRLKFGTQLFSSPTIEKLTGTDVVNGGRLRIVKEGAEFFLLSTSLGGAFYKTSFGSDLNNPTPTIINEGSFGASLQNSYGLGVAKENSVWNVSVVDQGTGKISKVKYSPSCPVVVDDPDFAKPIVHYSLPGMYTVALTKSLTGVSVSKSKNISVSNSIAPEIAFTTQNNCAQNDVLFQAQGNTATITSYDWDFGDTNTSAQSNPTHQYVQAGDYEAILIVNSNNGCKNLVKNSVTMYNKPIADFILPTANPYCTNQSYNFGNTSSFDVASNPEWEWSLNGIIVSSNFDLSAQFSSNQPQQIKLKSMIPGCESEIIKNISSVQVGAAPDFEFSNGCQGASITFTNTTTGAVVDYVWDFDDGNISSQQNGINSYMNSGLYQVTLQATNASGCQNFVTKPITIYSQPQPNFSLDLPPFSCAGSPSQFNDLTPPLTDSNITSRLWSFGDVSNGSSTQTNPTYTYNEAGDYQVSLGVSSNFGCSNTIQKTITIQPSPTVNFSNTPACLNQPTQFTDASGADVKAWLWSIQNISYTTKNVTHAFNTTGLQNAMLTVTGNNNCVSQISKTITIPVPVSIDFNSQSTCATKPSIFTETNSGGVDPAVSSIWDFAGQPGSGSPVQHVFSSVGSYPVKLNSTRLSGCVYSVTKSINIVQPPIARFTMTPENGGAPLTVDFTNTSIAATNFLWNFNDASNSTSAQFSPSFVFDKLGTYAVELIASNAIGCTDSVKKDVQVVVPQINAVLSEFRLEINTGGTLIATVTVENKGNITITNPEIYLDLSGNTEIKERLTGTIPPNQSITRTLTTSILPDNLRYVCAEVLIAGDSNAFDNRECINLENEITFIQPYPNPANDIIYLDWINQDLESLQVIIYNSSGQAVLNQTYYNLLHGLNQVEINVSQLAPGIYLASYSTGNNPYTFKFSVIR